MVETPAPLSDSQKVLSSLRQAPRVYQIRVGILGKAGDVGDDVGLEERVGRQERPEFQRLDGGRNGAGGRGVWRRQGRGKHGRNSLRIDLHSKDDKRVE